MKKTAVATINPTMIISYIVRLLSDTQAQEPAAQIDTGGEHVGQGG